MTFDAALEVAEKCLKTDTVAALRHAQQCWHSALGLFSGGGEIPDAPAIDDEDDEEDD